MHTRRDMVRCCVYQNRNNNRQENTSGVNRNIDSIQACHRTGNNAQIKVTGQYEIIRVIKVIVVERRAHQSHDVRRVVRPHWPPELINQRIARN
jgi:hypothetical protein